MEAWRRIAAKLVCPACRHSIAPEGAALACAACGRRYPVLEGIPHLVLFSPESGPGRSTRDYEERYQDLERARRYNRKYARQPLKRLSTWRERAILDRLLAARGRCETLLEIPCGGGRLSDRLAPHADLLVQADIGIGQVLLARERAGASPPRAHLTASALRIPFADGALDAAVCIRLAHHLRQTPEREALVRELLRVSRRYVVVTFFDHDAVKNRLRLARGKRSKLTMTVAQVARLAAEGGARLAACPRLSWWGSGHRYALLVKEAGG